MMIFKKSFTLFLAGFIVLGSLILLPPSDAQAVGVKFTGCTVGGVLANQFQAQIENGIKDLGKKIGLNLFGGSVLGGSVPVVDEKFISTWARKESRADIIARCAAREIFNGMSSGIINTARTAGRNGGPVFIRNWRNFQTESQYRGEGIFRAMLSNTKLCDYFGNDLKGLFGATARSALPRNTRTNNVDPYTLRANCTLPSNFSLNNYQQNFSENGGWQAWTRMLEPQNNYYGALFGALDETSQQRNLEESVDLNQALANKGLLGTSGGSASDSCKTRDANGRCLEFKDIKTPGSIISDSVAATFQQELAWITNVDELSEVISAATEVLLKRLTDFSDPNEGDYTIYEPSSVSEPTEPGDGGSCSAPLPVPAGSPPNMANIVQQVASEFPQYLANSCQDAGGTWQFMDEVVNRLHAQDPNWGYNGKRGDTNNLSQDAVSYLAGGTTEVFIIDIIGSHCGGNPQPAWIDVTAETYQCGVTGAYVYPRSGGGGGSGEPTPEPAF